MALHHIETNLNHTQPQQPQPHHHDSTGGSSSPVAPAYSPITPKAQPVLPASVNQPPFVPPENGGNFTFSPDPQDRHTQQSQPRSTIAPTEYIPQPPNLPFSSEDATDAIALRAAISTLQFQKKKARDDLKTLESIKQLALDDPSHFKTELAAGRLNEQRPRIGDLRAILDGSDDEDGEDEVKLGASQDDDGVNGHAKAQKTPEIPDSQPSEAVSTPDEAKKQNGDATTAFPRIPGPQSVVRMPPVNWDKYGVVGEPLNAIHEQQRRWPGTNAGFGQNRGREHTIAAPFSPFLDNLDPHADPSRKDSAATPGGTISEHPMETRSRG